MDGWMDGWLDEWMDGWMDGCMDGWNGMNGWMARFKVIRLPGFLDDGV